ncbi:MAG: alanine dehydrogenase [Mariprofundaceae bacterium]|nr:alanine dehydrogenase [Mariprofundaceae bacterium]
MMIGIPGEIKNREHRVAITPGGARQLVQDGHKVCVEHEAGAGSGFSDTDYEAAGASIAATPEDVWAADLVLKIKEPLPEEYIHLRCGQCLFTYLHLAAAPSLLDVLLEKGVRAIAYETVQADDGGLPLLAPMSRIAGRLATQIGASLLQKENGTPYPGRGVLMGGVPGVEPARVLVLGGGNVGRNAAEVALGMGASVQILDANVGCVAALRQRFAEAGNACEIRFFAEQLMFEALETCDLLIGAALIPGEHAPALLTPSYLERMKGGVFVDVAIDQGGISQTSHPSSYDEPVYAEAGVLHCCLPNLPAVVPVSATQALTHATLPYVRHLANAGMNAVREDAALARGVNTWDGHVTHRGVAHALGRDFTPLSCRAVNSS